MYDYIVVGAGSAGCVLANRLSADPSLRVLLLEAGGTDRLRDVSIPAAFPRLIHSGLDWQYHSEPEQNLLNRSIYLPRGRVLGGSSSINAQIFQRGHRADFEEWQRLGNSEWGFEEALPYYQRLENFEGALSPLRGKGGPVNVTHLRDPNPLSQLFLDAARQEGIPLNPDYNGAHAEGCAMVQVTQRNGVRESAATAYLRPVLNRPNLTVETDVLVEGVILEAGRATGVRCRKSDTTRVETAAQEVILSAGAYNSPQLLMLSGIGPAAQLADLDISPVADLPGVGTSLQDHLMCIVMWECRQPITLLTAQSLSSFFKFLLFKKGPLTSNVAEAMALVRTVRQSAAPDLELLFAPVQYDISQPPRRHCYGIAAVALQPHSRGTVSLRTPSPDDAPCIRHAYLSDRQGRDLDVLRQGIRLIRKIGETAPFDGLRGQELRPGSSLRTDSEIERFIRSRAETIYHPAGTCRMGQGSDAVVDQHLRVHQVAGLRVVDASVLPTLVRAHPNATVMMVAERVADWILAERR